MIPFVQSLHKILFAMTKSFSPWERKLRASFAANARLDGAFDTKPRPSNSNSIMRLPAPEVEIDFTARVEEVENAREPVRKGVIQGIRSSDTFQGSINSRLIHLPTWNPYSDPFLMAYKATFPIFPEPEIHYPAGTEIRLAATKEILVPTISTNTSRESHLADEADSDRLEQLVEGLPLRVTTTKHLDADLLNIVFVGSEDQVTAAFRAAGWHNADPVTKKATLKSLYALLNNSAYPQQPMTTFHFEWQAAGYELAKKPE